MEDKTPDHTTICRFRNLFVEKQLLHKLLDEINGQLIHQGKLIKTGCSVDASIFASASHPSKHMDIEFVPEDRKKKQDTAAKS